ncbi:sensor histidine kinase [Halobacillus fulvus]|nr:sensor histidine kinase [Halobacillus fulvus]
MSFKRMPIQWKITILSFGVVLFAIIIGGIIVIGNQIESKEEELGEHGMITGRTVANLPLLQEYLDASEGWKQINPMVERIRTINNTDYIVVLNMNRIRFSHPVEEKLGTVSSGSDEGPAFAEHSYTSKAEGELGVAVRSFVPVMDENHEQIGVVVVGNLLPSVKETLWEMKNEIFFILFLTSLFGVAGSWLLARHLKEQTFHLEPHEIVQLLVERTATFQAMNEGIVATDSEGRISIINEKAKKILGVESDLTGKDAGHVLPEFRLTETLEDKQATYNEEVRLEGKLVMTSKVPIQLENQTIGVVAIFQDRTEVTRLAEELTGVKAFVDALRVQNHEHLNKMHTIAGLIQLNRNDQALDFVFEATESQENLSKFLVQKLKDYSLSGLLLSKVSRGRELGIELIIDTHSELHEYPPYLDNHDFVLMLGNLIENAFHSFDGIEREKRIVEVSIFQDEHVCEIAVEDNGKGMDSRTKERMLDKGFTTKGNKGSGIGLYLVKRIVDKGSGTLEVDSVENRGTSIVITLPMSAEEDAYEQATGH